GGALTEGGSAQAREGERMTESGLRSDEVLPGGRTLSRRAVLGAGLVVAGQALLGADAGGRPAERGASVHAAAPAAPGYEAGSAGAACPRPSRASTPAAAIMSGHWALSSSITIRS